MQVRFHCGADVRNSGNRMTWNVTSHGRQAATSILRLLERPAARSMPCMVCCDMYDAWFVRVILALGEDISHGMNQARISVDSSRCQVSQGFQKVSNQLMKSQLL